jgi:uncharacterized membrane protein
MQSPSLSNRWLDRWFFIVVVFKGLNGAAEILSGIALLFISNSNLQHLLAAIGHWNIVVHSALLTRALHSVSVTYTPGLQLYTAVYALLHGIIKVGLVIALLSRRYALYPAAIVVLILFMIYQIYRIVTAHSIVFDATLTIIDAVVVWLTIIEYRRHTSTD